MRKLIKMSLLLTAVGVVALSAEAASITVKGSDTLVI